MVDCFFYGRIFSVVWAGYKKEQHLYAPHCNRCCLYFLRNYYKLSAK